MSLDQYKKKRNFSKTSEPTGDKSLANKLPIFVIQKHEASHLHYDFRLEIADVLKSWAIPKGPSENPRDKRLAVQTEDHPLAYAKFSGIIPKGEYGAGRVAIWDTGIWEPIGDPEQGLKNGKLQFKLFGKKLTGTWVLLHFKKGTKNWLLIKERDL